MLLLATAQLLKLEGQYIGKDGHAPELPLVDVRHDFLLIVHLDVCIKLEVSQEPLILLSIRVLFHEELPLQQENVSFDFQKHTCNSLSVVRQVVDEDGLLLLVSHQVRFFNVSSMAPTGDLFSLFLSLADGLFFCIHDMLWLKLVKRCLLRFLIRIFTITFIVVSVKLSASAT